MAFELPHLPYAVDALAPTISAETIEYHYSKHHQTYVTNLNKLVVGSEFENASLEAIIIKASGPIFNNAAQIWNHSFYWQGLSPDTSEPTGELAAAINKTFGSLTVFKEKFTASALANFGSGWTWLVKTNDGELAIVNTSNAGCPLTDKQTPLLTIDVWEHAYYIDHRNARPSYVAAFWGIVNWDFVANNFAT